MKKFILALALCTTALPSLAPAQSKEMGILSRMNFVSDGSEQSGDSAIAVMRARPMGDTLDKIDPAQMRQNVAAWTVMLSVMSNSDAELGPPPTTE